MIGFMLGAAFTVLWIAAWCEIGRLSFINKG